MADNQAEDTSEEFESLLRFLKQTRGFDFTGYKRASLMRRVERRMAEVNVAGYGDYLDFLEVHPEEFLHLFNMILINVTGFFRDPPAWEYVQDHIAPEIAATNGPIRVWSAGCASGEEAYSVAMMLAEVLGDRAFTDRVKIYATDADDEALNQARLGIYRADDMQAVPEPLREKYFAATDHSFAVRKDLRRAVIFGKHDLMQDAPISKIDLLICRNTLMYFNADAQSQILRRFNYALRDSGYLFLGKSEMLLTHTDLFEPVELKKRVFRKAPHAVRENLRYVQVEGFGWGGEEVGRLREAAFDASKSAEFVVDAENRLHMMNARARSLFGLRALDIGRALQDLELSYRPVDLRSLIDEALRERRPTNARDATWPAPTGEPRQFDVDVVPLFSAEGEVVGYAVTFSDVTPYRRLQEDLQTSKKELETAYEELQSTVEELETTNEELHSTNEELETTNEELQSTNEELETMNEELHSTIEEMETVNQELEDRTGELNHANLSLESILASIRVGVVVLDRELRILVWNHRAEDMWGLRSDEVRGEHLLNLDIGLPIEKIRAPIREAMAKGASQFVDVEALTRRGRAIVCHVTCTPMTAGPDRVEGVILLMEPVEEAAQD